jgi:hypothetical protein
VVDPLDAELVGDPQDFTADSFDAVRPTITACMSNPPSKRAQGTNGSSVSWRRSAPNQIIRYALQPSALHGISKNI